LINGYVTLAKSYELATFDELAKIKKKSKLLTNGYCVKLIIVSKLLKSSMRIPKNYWSNMLGSLILSTNALLDCPIENLLYYRNPFRKPLNKHHLFVKKQSLSEL
jgi:hypothetical protein